jgi:hypothetical protein
MFSLVVVKHLFSWIKLTDVYITEGDAGENSRQTRRIYQGQHPKRHFLQHNIRLH